MRQIALYTLALTTAFIFGTTSVSAQHNNHPRKPNVEQRRDMRPQPKHHHDRHFKHQPQVSPNTLIVFTENTPRAQEKLMKAVRKSGAHIVYQYHNMSGVAIRKPANWSLEKTRRYFAHVKGVTAVDYDRVNHLHAMR